MKRATIFLTITFMLFASFGTNALAEQQGMGQKSQTGQQSQMGTTGKDMSTQQENYRASNLMGKALRNEKGEDLGNINDVVFGPEGRISFVVVSYGGVLGVGEKLIPVPWRAITRQTGQDYYVLRMDKEKFASAPSFTTEEWQKLGDPQWERNVFGYYGVERGEMDRGHMEGHRGAMEGQQGSRGTMGSQQGTMGGQQGSSGTMEQGRTDMQK